MRICVVSERLSPNLDDGIKNIAFALIRELRKDHTVLGLSEWEDVPEYCTAKFHANRFYVSYDLARKVGRFRPQVIIYVPWTSATVRSLFRTWMLKRYGHGARTVLIATQPAVYSIMTRCLLPWLQPDLILAQSEDYVLHLSACGCRAAFMPSGVDLERFVPLLDATAKAELRRTWGLDPAGFIILHVGHIEPKRLDPELLGMLQAKAGVQVLVVGSPHTPQDAELKDQLTRRGVRVICDYVANIQDIYHLADCYLFPLHAFDACIGVPLSVMEAMASNLPVVTTRFQGLPALFMEDGDVKYADTNEEFLRAIMAIRNSRLVNTREKVESYSWRRMTEEVLAKAMQP